MRPVAVAAITALTAVTAVTAVLVTLVGPAAGAASGIRAAGQAVIECESLLVQSSWPGARSTLIRVSLPAGTATTVGSLGYPVNAIGYAEGQGFAYGITVRYELLLFPRGHLVAIDRYGNLTDLGPPRGTGLVQPPLDGLADATAGAIAGTKLYLRDEATLYTVDIDPASPRYLAAVAAVQIRPAGGANSYDNSYAYAVDDFDVDPATGLLYGVSTAGYDGAQLVTIAPGTGVLRTVPVPGGLPRHASYPAAVIGPDGALYAATAGGDRSYLYRIPLDGSGPATIVTTRPSVASADAAGCRRGPPPPPGQPPPVPPPPISPSPVPPSGILPSGVLPSGVPSGPPTEPAPGSPVSASLTATSTISSAQPTVSGPPPSASGPAGRRATLPPRPLSAPDTIDATDKKRRWLLALLLLVLGLGGAARSAARRR